MKNYKNYGSKIRFFLNARKNRSKFCSNQRKVWISRNVSSPKSTPISTKIISQFNLFDQKANLALQLSQNETLF